MNFLSGVAVGVALGILFAPQKGTRTRTMIADKARSLKVRVAGRRGNGPEYVSAEEDARYAV